MTIENLLFIGLFLLILLVRAIRPRGQRPLPPPAGSTEGDQADALFGPGDEAPPTNQPGPEIRHAVRRAEAPAGQASSDNARARRLGGLADARRGIVLMTILGPCRALSEHDTRRGEWTNSSRG